MHSRYRKKHFCWGYLVEEAEDLASNVLATSLLVVHDTGGGSQDDETELTRGQQLDNPLLEVTELDVVAGADNTGLVQAVDFVRNCSISA